MALLDDLPPPTATTLPLIAPVELLLVVVGIDALISRAVEKVGKGKLREMTRIPGEIQSLARKMVRGELEPSLDMSDFDWRKDVKELAAGWDVQQVIDMAKQFPPELQAAASALIIKSKAVIDKLSKGLPLAKYQTVAGSTDLMPADAHIFKFAVVLEVVRNPLLVISLMAGGALLKTQAAAVRVIYPTLSACIDAAIMQATIAAKSEKKSFELTEPAEAGVKCWFGNGPVPTTALKQSQANVAASNQRKQSAVPPKSRPGNLLTAAAKAEAKPETPV